MNRTRTTILLMLLPAALLAQREGRPGRREAPPGMGQQLTSVVFETHAFASPEPGKLRIDLLYRIPRRFFVFTRSSPADPLRARAEISVDLLDARGGAAGHRIVRRNLDAAGGESEGFVEGVFSLTAAPGAYSVVLDVTDGESSRRFRSEERKMDLRTHRAAILLCSPDGARGDSSLIPLNQGGDVPFGGDAALYGEVPLPPGSKVPIVVSLRRNDSLRAVVRDTVLATGRLLAPPADDTLPLVYAPWSSPPPPGVSAVVVRLPGDSLREGTYGIVIGAEPSDSATMFHVRWFDKPQSLRYLPAAVDALSYIATEDEFHAMRDASPDRQEMLFDEFWKKRDRTPSTPYNEVEAEYYRRVDRAMQNYSTLTQRNGAKTDMGKAFILYGAPDSTSREFDPSSAPREIWMYARLHKRLIFTDPTKRGDYHLTAAEAY